jgi:hypothetical protein
VSKSATAALHAGQSRPVAQSEMLNQQEFVVVGMDRS